MHRCFQKDRVLFKFDLIRVLSNFRFVCDVVDISKNQFIQPDILVPTFA
jgi:hypothetical protein